MCKIISTLISFLFFINQVCYPQKVLVDNMQEYIEKIDSLKGKKMPNFMHRTINGKLITNRNFKNKITLISFSFESCQPCINEIYSLNYIFNKYKKNTSFQTLNFTFDSLPNIKKLIRKFHISYNNFISISHEECWRLNFYSGYPTLFIINRQGRISLVKSGGYPNFEETFQDFNKTVIPYVDSLLYKHPPQ